jgi:hypothetical protein
MVYKVHVIALHSFTSTSKVNLSLCLLQLTGYELQGNSDVQAVRISSEASVSRAIVGTSDVFAAPKSSQTRPRTISQAVLLGGRAAGGGQGEVGTQ